MRNVDRKRERELLKGSERKTGAGGGILSSSGPALMKKQEFGEKQMEKGSLKEKNCTSKLYPPWDSDKKQTCGMGGNSETFSGGREKIR